MPPSLAPNPATGYTTLMAEPLISSQVYPAQDGFRMPAEWALHRRCWMCWPCRLSAWGDREGLLRAKEATARVARAIAQFEPVVMAARPEDAAEAMQFCSEAVEMFKTPLDDSWARDIGPSFLAGPQRAGVAWQFNAWGEKYRPYDNDRAFAALVLERENARLYRAPLVCEGGAIHVDGQGTLITTEQCLLNPNRNPGIEREQVETTLACCTGAIRVIWLHGTFSDEETDGHIDNIACLAGPGRIILGIPASRSHPDWGAVQAARRQLAEARDARGEPFEIIDLPQPQNARPDWRGRPLAASYVNFYLANGGLVMPAFDDPADLAARSVLADCFPEREIAQVDALAIVQGGGGIHCITQQEPA
ncbi:MAG TPA: agmatine deiminase family protein [Rhizomicrobium sp.]|nr:agmatine deiminase family protein [Rhizomicrobium sp.]